jgi:hypothetical protein
MVFYFPKGVVVLKHKTVGLEISEIWIKASKVLAGTFRPVSIVYIISHFCGKW